MNRLLAAGLDPDEVICYGLELRGRSDHSVGQTKNRRSECGLWSAAGVLPPRRDRGCSSEHKARC